MSETSLHIEEDPEPSSIIESGPEIVPLSFLEKLREGIFEIRHQTYRPRVGQALLRATQDEMAARARLLRGKMK